MPPESRTQRNKREVRERILAAARELFDQDGVEATKIEAICDRADIALRTFFNHFPTKKDLVHQLAVDAALAVAARVQSVCETAPSTTERLELFFLRSAEIGREAGPMHSDLLGHLIAAHDKPEDLAHARHAMLELIQAGIAQGDVTKLHSPETLTDAILGTFYRIITDYTQREGYPVEEHLRNAARFLCSAIAPDRAASTHPARGRTP